jgi:hypothetical protein
MNSPDTRKSTQLFNEINNERRQQHTNEDKNQQHRKTRSLQNFRFYSWIFNNSRRTKRKMEKYLPYNYEKKDRAEKSTTHKSECKWVKAGVVEKSYNFIGSSTTASSAQRHEANELNSAAVTRSALIFIGTAQL